MQGKTGIITWNDNSTSRVIIKELETFSNNIPSDYWLDYLPGEGHRPIIHPDLGISELVKSAIVIPESFLLKFFKED